MPKPDSAEACPSRYGFWYVSPDLLRLVLFCVLRCFSSLNHDAFAVFRAPGLRSGTRHRSGAVRPSVDCDPMRSVLFGQAEFPAISLDGSGASTRSSAALVYFVIFKAA